MLFEAKLRFIFCKRDDLSSSYDLFEAKVMTIYFCCVQRSRFSFFNEADLFFNEADLSVALPYPIVFCYPPLSRFFDLRFFLLCSTKPIFVLQQSRFVLQRSRFALQQSRFIIFAVFNEADFCSSTKPICSSTKPICSSTKPISYFLLRSMNVA